VEAFRKLMLVALLAGTIAGLAWFAVQYAAVLPFIESAERYEAASPDHHEHDEGWRPADGWQRNSLTALSTVFTSIGFASILFGLVSLMGRQMDAGRGALWGLAAFTCFALAPALGLPPEPPGMEAADIGQRQLWWTATAMATAAGLFLLRASSWWPKLAGLACLAAPHLVGAPAASGSGVVPAGLVRQFILASLSASAVFWLTLGVVGGYFYRRWVRHAQV
jgi:cobalt transporter subunit CbtA